MVEGMSHQHQPGHAAAHDYTATHDRTAIHDHTGGDPAGEAALTELLDLEGEVLAGYLSAVTAWIAAAAGPPVSRIVDLGAGTGTGTFALLRRFPGARVTAVDLDAGRLHRLRERACQLGLDGRIDVAAVDLDQPWPALGPADLVWASMSMHHLGDPGQALARIFGLLRPAGSLAIAETSARESFPRFLPGDGGLEDRVHDALAARHAEQVPELGADWHSRLTAAGFTITAEREFAIRLDPPLPPAAGRYAQLTLDRLRAGLAGQLDPADQQALALLVADDGPGSVRHRAGLTVRATRLAWLARRP
jgi:SAM-dependent methyltransferase